VQGPGCCDHNHTERAANIVTSLPYLAIGVDSYRCGLEQLQAIVTIAARQWGALPMYMHACLAVPSTTVQLTAKSAATCTEAHQCQLPVPPSYHLSPALLPPLPPDHMLLAFLLLGLPLHLPLLLRRQATQHGCGQGVGGQHVRRGHWVHDLPQQRGALEAVGPPPGLLVRRQGRKGEWGGSSGAALSCREGNDKALACAWNAPTSQAVLQSHLAFMHGATGGLRAKCIAVQYPHHHHDPAAASLAHVWVPAHHCAA
jgi:hypothetical protein